MICIDETTLQRIERDHEHGVTSAQILEFFAHQDFPFSEATLRKYVQLGLLPRSVRVGRKGKHQGSQGVYPVKVIRQILHIKGMMAENYTIEQIQREFLFVRKDLQQLEEALRSVFGKLATVLRERRRDATTQAVTRQFNETRGLGKDLLARLGAIETRLSSQARVERAAAS
jgi:DNA-binding transcriptional MerR regulator